MNFTSLLTSLQCLACAWSILGGFAIFAAVSFFMNSWVPFRGPVPSDGPVEGFASKQARIDFYNTHDVRVRAAAKAAAIGAGIWLVGIIVVVVAKGAA